MPEPLPVQLSVPPRQPDEDTYAIHQLLLCPVLDRATYKQKYGVQAPMFDPTRPVQRWLLTDYWDGTPRTANETVELLGWSWDARTFQTFRTTRRNAATPNLPGAYVWPLYLVAPSGAYRDQFTVDGSPTGGKQYIKPDSLSLMSDALALVAELKEAGFAAGNIYTTPESGNYALRFEPTESRREWLISFEGVDGGLVVGYLLADKNRMGVGRPGTWVPSATTNKLPSWKPADKFPTGEDSTLPIQPHPCRPLLENEELVTSPFGVTVQKKRPVVVVAEASNNPAIAAQLQEVIATLQRLETGLAAIRKYLLGA